MAGPRAMLAAPTAPTDPVEPPSLDLAPVTPVPPAPVARPSLRPVGDPLGESTIEFDLVSRQPRKVGDAVKPTSPASAASKLERVRTDARSVNTDARKLVPDTSLTRIVTNPDITVPAKRQPSPVARFPSLVPSKPSGLVQNRWVAGSVLAAVIFVVCFVLARGL